MSENIVDVPSFNITCPYCGNHLHVNLEWVGSAYMQTQEVEGFECLEIPCGADWDAKGTLLRKPNWGLYPDSYENPNPEFSEKFIKNS